MKGGVYVCEKFFGKYLEVVELIKDLSDEDIDNLNCGGYDLYKVFVVYVEVCIVKG